MSATLLPESPSSRDDLHDIIGVDRCFTSSASDPALCARVPISLLIPPPLHPLNVSRTLGVSLNHGEWTAEEDFILVEKFNQLGQKVTP